MHGLALKALQTFLRQAYGAEFWMGVATETGAPPDGFEAMLTYPDRTGRALVACASLRLGRTPGVLLEDLGQFVAGLDPVRRLLRFGGADFQDFLLSLEDIHQRAALAVPELDLPEVRVADRGGHSYGVTLSARHWLLPILAGILRAMADDYGALVLIDRTSAGVGAGVGAECDGPGLSILLVDARHAAGRDFALVPGGGA